MSLSCIIRDVVGAQQILLMREGKGDTGGSKEGRRDGGRYVSIRFLKGFSSFLGESINDPTTRLKTLHL